MDRYVMFVASCLLALLPIAVFAQPADVSTLITSDAWFVFTPTDSRPIPSPDITAQSTPQAEESTTSTDAADADALAKQLANPVASLISVPFQFNYDTPVGADGDRLSLNIQPVIPITLSDNWNMISRTIVPLIHQRDVIPGQHQTGLGDLTQTVFFSPSKPSASGVIWGAGPVLVLPTGERGLGAKTWGAGASVVVLKQLDDWTLGALANHVVDGGGGRDRLDISATFLQPFVTKAFDGGRSVNVNTEATYDWNAHEWTVPINLVYAKVSKIGNQL